MAFTPDRTMASAVRVTTRNVHTSTGTDTATTAVTVATETRISSSRHTGKVSCADTTKASGAITTIAGATETMGVGRSKAHTKPPDACSSGAADPDSGAAFLLRPSHTRAFLWY